MAETIRIGVSPVWISSVTPSTSCTMASLVCARTGYRQSYYQRYQRGWNDPDRADYGGVMMQFLSVIIISILVIVASLLIDDDDKGRR